MKNIHRKVWSWLLLMLPLLGVKCEKEDIVKATQFEVTVRVTGENLGGLGAEVRVSSVRNVLNPSAGPGLTYSYPINANVVYSLGTFGLQDQVTAEVAFHNVSCSGVVRPASDSKLKVEVLANGFVVNVVELTPATTGGSFICNPYWLNTTVGNGDDWD
jgi:hypothetical protein